MSETLVVFQSAIIGPDGERYEGRACGREVPSGLWEGWIEFTPLAGGAIVRTERETTQPNRTDTEYWATGLTPVYLEGALKRALGEVLGGGSSTSSNTPAVTPALADLSNSSAPLSAAHTSTAHTVASHDSILNPFSVYNKGEALLRGQLGALSAWHLVNIVLDFDLSDLGVEALNHMPQATLADLIVTSVRHRVELQQAARTS